MLYYTHCSFGNIISQLLLFTLVAQSDRDILGLGTYIICQDTSTRRQVKMNVTSQCHMQSIASYIAYTKRIKNEK